MTITVGGTNITLNSGSVLQDPSGTAPGYVCRAWVNMDGGAATIRSSGNVSSVSRASAGRYTINFSTAMTDANYSAVVTAGYLDDGDGVNQWGLKAMYNTPATYTSSSLGIIVNNQSSAQDSLTVSVVVFR